MSRFQKRIIDPCGLARRDTRPELMDDPACETKKLIRTVRQFALINVLFTRSLTLASRYLIPRSAGNSHRPLSVLDVGAGGGDFARRLSRWAQRRKILLSVTCIDQDPHIVEFATERCRGYANISICRGDIRTAGFGNGSFDCVFANHFLHHIPEEYIPATISQLNSLAKERLLINDTRRSALSCVGYALFSRLFLHGSFAAYDGLLSIRRGFTKGELINHIARAGLSGCLAVGRTFPGRLFVYRRTQ